MTDHDSSTEQRPPAYQTGDIIDSRYEVEALLGQGGMGDVYRVRDTQNGAVRALKLLSQHVMNDSILRRFHQEFELIQQLNSPAIITSYEYGTAAGCPYFTMECLEGGSLRDIIGKKTFAKRLTIRQALRYLLQIAQGLSHAHSANVVHRDIKPENILLTKTGDAKISDFGIGRSLEHARDITQTGQMVGTVDYMSPEQLLNEKLTPSADMYTLGILAFELVAGITPFDDGSLFVMMERHTKKPLPSLREINRYVPQWYQDFVERCCEKKPADRYHSMQEVVEKLTVYLQYEDSPLAPLKRIFRNCKAFLTGPYSSPKRSGPALGAINVDRKEKFLYEAKRIARKILRSGLLLRFGSAAIAGFVYLFALCDIRSLPQSGIWAASLEYAAMDTWFALRGVRAVPQEVVLIYIDEKTFIDLGESKVSDFRRSRFAELLELLAKFQPKAIVLDYLFDKASTPDDARLAKALALTPTYIAWYPTVIIQTDIDGTDHISVPESHSAPLFTKAAAGEFFANRPKDNEILRRFRTSAQQYDEVPATAKVVLRDTLEIEALPGIRDFLNYYGPTKTLPNLSASSVFSGDPDYLRRNIQGKYVFIGQDIKTIHGKKMSDEFMTPYHLISPGVELHASAAANLLDRSWIVRMAPQSEACYAMLLGAILGYILFAVSPVQALAVPVCALIAWAVSAYVAFTRYYFFLPGAALVIVIIPVLTLFSLARKPYAEYRSARESKKPEYTITEKAQDGQKQ